MEYRLKDSIERIEQIIKTNDNAYQEIDKIPGRSALTYTNGFFLKCSTVSVEIRESSLLTELQKDKTLVKLYRAFISEVAAAMNGNPKCAEIDVNGNCVSGFFDTPLKEEINETFSTTGKISSIIDIMNYKFKKNNMRELTIGIGMAYGKALLMKMGYKGADKMVWMGDVVDEAKRLASYGSFETTDKETMVSETVYYNLDERNKKLLALNPARNCYHGDIVNSLMNNWYKINCH